MAAFEAADQPAPWKVYKPPVSAHVDPRAWWRYSILTELYKVRCLQKEDTWRIAGDKNMHLLSHIRILIANNGGNVDGVDLSGASENYLSDTAERLRSLEAAVEILNRENMTLRKMVKVLLTPLAKENLIGDAESLQYIENQIATYELHAATTKLLEASEEEDLSPDAASSVVQNTLTIEAEDYVESEDEQLVASINAQDNNIRSPYENILPPIALTERDRRDPTQGTSIIKGKLSAPNSGRAKPKKDVDKFPSYLEREAMRKEQARKKREQIILQSAELLVQASIAAEQSALNGPNDALPALSARSVGSTGTANQQHSPSDSRSGKSPQQKSAKVREMPAWVDDVRVPDLLKGRGKGKAREPGDEKEGVNSKKSATSAKLRSVLNAEDGGCGGDGVATAAAASLSSPSQRAMSADANTGSTKALVDGLTGSSGRMSAGSSKQIFPRPSADMSGSEKLAAGIITKAREKVLKPEDTKKPLSNVEKTLLKSPLAMPLVKPLPTEDFAATTTVPREKVTRSNVSPRGGGGGGGGDVPQRGQSRKKPSPRKAPAAESPRGANKASSKSTRAAAVTSSSAASTPGSSAAVHSAVLSTQSAPPTVSASKAAAPQEPVVVSVQDSQMRDAASEKLKKKSVLKGLNERSNPNSPRKDVASQDTAAADAAETEVDAPTGSGLARRLEMEEDEGEAEALEPAESAAVISAVDSLFIKGDAERMRSAAEDTEEDTIDADCDVVLSHEETQETVEAVVQAVVSAAVQAAVESLRPIS